MSFFWQEPSMKEEIRDLLSEYGREAFLRQKTDQRCDCWDEVKKESDPECPSCSNTGWVYLDYKVVVYKLPITQSRSGAYRRRDASPGILHTEEASFYMSEDNIHPSIHDWIVECRTKDDGTLDPPYDIQRIWEVNEVIDYRDNKGNLAFYEVRVKKLATGK